MGLYGGGRDRQRGRCAPPLPGQAGILRRATARLSAAASRSHPGLSPGHCGSRTRGTVRRAGTGPGRCPSHFIGTWPLGGGTHRRCRALLVHRGTGPHQQRPVRRGRRRCVFRRKAEYRHQGHPTPFYFRGAGKVRRTGGHSDRRQAPYRHGLPAHRPEKSAAGAIGRQDGPPL